MKRGVIKRRSKLRARGSQFERSAQETAAFRNALLPGQCERCATFGVENEGQDPHHLCSRARGVGHELLHNADANGAALCRGCHSLVEDHNCEDWRDWIKDRRWLDQGGRESDPATG